MSLLQNLRCCHVERNVRQNLRQATSLECQCGRNRSSFGISNELTTQASLLGRNDGTAYEINSTIQPVCESAGVL